jgi:hypothetical protein
MAISLLENAAATVRPLDPRVPTAAAPPQLGRGHWTSRRSPRDAPPLSPGEASRRRRGHELVGVGGLQGKVEMAAGVPGFRNLGEF